MRTQIRKGTFETNSSSNHTLVITNGDKFNDWKNGKLLARCKDDSECESCWGNFWSDLISLEFTDAFETAKRHNEEVFRKTIDDRIAKQEKYKKECMEYEPNLKGHLSSEEIHKLSKEERDKYYDDEYYDNLYRFDEENYNYWMEKYKNATIENFSKEFGMIGNGMWMTFNEFWMEFTQYDDCDSPFEHDDKENNVHVIGKYYHD